MKRIQLKILVIASALAFPASSCQKVIDLQLNNETGRLVIEGNVTNASGPQVVKLSQNVGFYSANTYPTVSGAKVNITDQTGRSYMFTEGQAGTYTNAALKGQRGYTYTLTVTANGRNYQGSSTMPPQVALDSLGYENDEMNTDGRKTMIAYYHDPTGPGNYYRFVEYVNNVEVRRTFTSDDTFSDGQRIGLILRQNDIHIYSGDVVKVEMQCIDKPIFTYWYALRQQQIGGAISGVTPADPPTNLNNNALGYFSVHTTQTRMATIR